LNFRIKKRRDERIVAKSIEYLKRNQEERQES